MIHFIYAILTLPSRNVSDDRSVSADYSEKTKVNE